MEKPEIIPVDAPSESALEPKASPAVNRLRHKAKALRGPRGKYRCRKCHELPCICEDPKQATPAPGVSDKAPAAPPVALFNEKNSKRLLEAGFGIPTVLTQCKLWALTEDEALELSKPTADVLNEFVSVDPKWVSLTVLSVSLGSIMARKAVLYSAWRRAMAINRANEAQRPAASSPGPEPKAGGEGEPEANGHSDDPIPGPSSSIDMLQ